MWNRHATKAGLVFSLILLSLPSALPSQETTRRGRKYKAPPETSHIEVLVLKESNGKPLVNAAVVFRAVRDGHDEGNLEVKTNNDGKAVIDVIATGSTVGIQVIASGFATYAGEYQIAEASREIEVRMLRPREQISTYVETHGQASYRTYGVQEPAKGTTAPVLQAPRPTGDASDPNPRTPLTPGATPGNSQNRTKPTSTQQPTGVPPQE